MGVAISQLTQGVNLPQNNSLLEFSEPLGPTTYESKGFTRIAATKRVYFNINVDPPSSALTIAKVRITYEQIKDMCDFDNLLADAGLEDNGDDSFLQHIFGTLHIAAVAYERYPAEFIAKNGATLSSVMVSPTSSTVRTFAGGELASVENFTRTLPDAVTYSITGNTKVFPIVAAVDYGPSYQGLEITFNLIWDEYAPTPGEIQISGYMDANLIPQLQYPSGG